MKTPSKALFPVLLMAFVITVQASAEPQKIGGAALAVDQAPRAISSLTIDDRTRLADNTMVKLKSGRVASLGTLRAEHRARQERFSTAAGLGRSMATKLVVQHSGSAPISRTAASVPSKPQTATQGSIVKEGAVKGNTNIATIPASVTSGSTLVPFTYTSLFPMPKDYADFCKAANPSVCIYLPANSTLSPPISPGPGLDAWVKGVVMDEDPLIFDKSICKYSGGTYLDTECVFYYLVQNLKDFKPTGPLTTSASCDAPAKYIVDPKGAVQASYPYSGSSFTTSATETKCVVQVWISR